MALGWGHSPKIASVCCILNVVTDVGEHFLCSPAVPSIKYLGPRRTGRGCGKKTDEVLTVSSRGHAGMGLAGEEAGSGGATTHCPCAQCSQHSCPTDHLLSNSLVCPAQPGFPRSHLPIPLNANLKTGTEWHPLTAGDPRGRVLVGGGGGGIGTECLCQARPASSSLEPDDGNRKRWPHQTASGTLPAASRH